jgi:tRNA threonylcarbamoyladenosine biosynthesis protein TsaB
MASRWRAGRRPAHDAGGAQASAALIPEHGLAAPRRPGAAELDAIAFGRGPAPSPAAHRLLGAARAGATAPARPVLAIDSLMLVADDAPRARRGAEVWVAMDARMDEIYAAPLPLAAGAGGDRRAGAVRLDASMRCAGSARAAVAGSALDAFGERCVQLGGADLLAPTGSRAAALGRLATAAWLDGEGVDAALALPVYLRDKVAQTTDERDAARALKTAQTAPAP